MKKLLVILALCMVLSVVLVACNNNDNPEETTPEVTTPEVTTPEATTPEETTPEATTPEETTPEATTPEETTPEETTTEETTEPEPEPDPAEPTWSIDAAGLAEKAAAGNMLTAELNEEEGYVRLTTTGGDPFFQFLNAAGVQPQYMAIVYRTNTTRQGQIFIGSGAGPNAQGDNPLFSWNGNEQWNILVLDLANMEGLTAITDGNVNYARLDFFTDQGAEGDYIDLKYIGFYNTAKYATDAFFSTIATIVPSADMADSIPGSPGITSATMSADNTFITIDTMASSDPYYQLPMLNGKGIVGQYVAIKYRTSCTSNAKSEMFVGSGGGPSGQGDNIQFQLTCDGNWQLAIVDLSQASAVVDGVVNYLRWDPFAGGSDATIDMAYIGVFASEADALAYDATLAGIYRNVPEHDDLAVDLGLREGANKDTPFSPASDKKIGQKLPLGETILKQITVTNLACYSDGNTNTWSLKIWAWNTDYETTVAGTPLYVLTGENHTDCANFVADIPVKLFITGDVYYELEYLTGTGGFTGWTAENIFEGVETYSGGVKKDGGYAASVVVGVPYVQPENGDAEHPLTVGQTLNAVAGLEEGAATDIQYYTTGVVTEIGQTGSYYKNVYFTDGEQTMLIYTLNPMEGMPELKVGDTITVFGYIKNYNGTIEFASKYVDDAQVYVYIVAHEAAPAEKVVVDPRTLPEGAITGHMTTVVDSSVTTGHYNMIAAAGLESGVMLHQGSIYLGEFNLAEYSKVVIYYATDWGEGTQTGLAAAKEQGFGRLGISAADCNGLMNPTEDKVFLANQYTPAGGWAITAQEITLGIEYNGPVYVSADFLGGQFIIIDRVEFVY